MKCGCGHVGVFSCPLCSTGSSCHLSAQSTPDLPETQLGCSHFQEALPDSPPGSSFLLTTHRCCRQSRSQCLCAIHAHPSVCLLAIYPSVLCHPSLCLSTRLSSLCVPTCHPARRLSLYSPSVSCVSIHLSSIPLSIYHHLPKYASNINISIHPSPSSL